MSSRFEGEAWRAGVVAVIVGGVLCPTRAPAQEPPTAETPPAQESDEVSRSKHLFDRGMALLEAGDCQRALEFFTDSRAAFATVQSTMNVAYCLNDLQRYDEALEMYEQVLTEFGTTLDGAQKNALAERMRDLRSKVGSLEVTANVEGKLVVDGRMRGSLPLLSPVRVMPGTRVVTVIKEGYESSPQKAEIAVGKTTPLVFDLNPIRGAGRVRVSSTELAGATLFIDGAEVGTLPWDGELPPGKHLMQAIKGDRGTGLRQVSVIEGRVTAVAPEVFPLGPEQTLAVHPSSAAATLDGVPLPAAQWRGRLPMGQHILAAAEEGYVPQQLQFSTSGNPERTIQLALEVDRNHPRWAAASTPGAFHVALFGGVGFGSSIGSGAEDSCSGDPTENDASFSCSTESANPAGVFGIRGGYEFANGLGLDVVGGFAILSSNVTRETVRPAGGVDTTFTFTDSLSARGPFVGPAVSYRIGAPFWFSARAAVGVMFLNAKDDVEGRASQGAAVVATNTVESGASTTGPQVFVLPELSAGYDLTEVFRLSLGVGVLFTFLDGPSLDTGRTEVVPLNDPCVGVGCVGSLSIVNEEKAFGRSVFVVPSAALQYSF